MRPPGISRPQGQGIVKKAKIQPFAALWYVLIITTEPVKDQEKFHERVNMPPVLLALCGRAMVFRIKALDFSSENRRAEADMETKEILYFDEPGPANTDAVLQMAKKKIEASGPQGPN